MSISATLTLARDTHRGGSVRALAALAAVTDGGGGADMRHAISVLYAGRGLDRPGRSYAGTGRSAYPCRPVVPGIASMPARDFAG